MALAIPGDPGEANVMETNTTYGPGRVDPSDLHPHTFVGVCDECVPAFYARSWAYLARSDAEWHNTVTGHDVSILGADGSVESLTNDGWVDR